MTSNQAVLLLLLYKNPIEAEFTIEEDAKSLLSLKYIVLEEDVLRITEKGIEKVELILQQKSENFKLSELVKISEDSELTKQVKDILNKKLTLEEKQVLRKWFSSIDVTIK